jgi:glycine betaine/proline transport system substrate-binding protein
MKFRHAVWFLLSLGAQAESSCGKVSIADMNWSSASIIAHLDQFILEHGYGCDTELVPGATMPTLQSMLDSDTPDIAPELWTHSVKTLLDEGVADKRLRVAGHALLDGGEEGFWLPQYLLEQYPELATIEGVKQHAELFPHPHKEGASGFHGCPKGWNCYISAKHLFDALQLEQAGFEWITTSSGYSLSASIAEAYQQQQGWLGYYWAPTAVLGKYPMVKVDFASGVDPEEFTHCTTQQDCLQPKVTMYPAATVHSVTTERFAISAPAAYDYISKRAFSNQQMNQLLAWMEQQQADAQTSMYYFLQEYPTIWQAWVSEAAAIKIKQVLPN